MNNFYYLKPNNPKSSIELELFYQTREDEHYRYGLFITYVRGSVLKRLNERVLIAAGSMHKEPMNNFAYTLLED